MTSQPDSSNLTSWGSSFASFLLGDLSNASTTLPSTTGYRFGHYSLFAQDDFRVTSKLTLSYGLRWDVATAPYEVNGQVSSFSPTVMNPVGVQGALVFGGSGAGRTGNQFVSTWKKGFGPRLGLAYALTPEDHHSGFGRNLLFRCNRHRRVYRGLHILTQLQFARWLSLPSITGEPASFPSNYSLPPQISPEFPE